MTKEHNQSESAPWVAVCMGSTSDLDTMRPAAALLREFGVPTEVRILSAHRTPERMFDFGRNAQARGLEVIIAGAGGAAHLPGMLSSLTTLPVIGVPVPLRHLDGLDALLSIVQMPRGTPVATVGVGNASNAAHLALRILGAKHPEIRSAIAAYQASAIERVSAEDDRTRHGE